MTPASALGAVGREFETRTYPYDETARSSATKAGGFLQAIIDLDGEILGCHVIGPEASDLIQEIRVMRARSGTVQKIRESGHIHPALLDVVQRSFSGHSVTVTASTPADRRAGRHLSYSIKYQKFVNSIV